MIRWEPGETLKDLRKRVMFYTYEYCNYSKVETAKILGISLRTVRTFFREPKDKRSEGAPRDEKGRWLPKLEYDQEGPKNEPRKL